MVLDTIDIQFLRTKLEKAFNIKQKIFLFNLFSLQNSFEFGFLKQRWGKAQPQSKFLRITTKSLMSQSMCHHRVAPSVSMMMAGWKELVYHDINFSPGSVRELRVILLLTILYFFCLWIGTVWTASAHIITAVIGSGVLSLAWATAQLGWIAGPTVMLLFAFVTYYTSVLLSSCYRSGDPVTGKRNYTYMDAVRANLGNSFFFYFSNLRIKKSSILSWRSCKSNFYLV